MSFRCITEPWRDEFRSENGVLFGVPDALRNIRNNGKRSNLTLPPNVVTKDTASGLSAGLYEPKNPRTGQTEYAFVYRGSEWEWNDLGNNFKQPFGPSKQYAFAAYNADVLSQFFGRLGKPLIFIGHSLGGGLAALSSLITGRPAITFNPAGISDATKAKYGVRDKWAPVTNFVVEREAVSYAQNSFYTGLKPEGTTHKLKSNLPNINIPIPHAGDHGGIPVVAAIKHSMSQVIRALHRECD